MYQTRGKPQVNLWHNRGVKSDNLDDLANLCDVNSYWFFATFVESLSIIQYNVSMPALFGRNNNEITTEKEKCAEIPFMSDVYSASKIRTSNGYNPSFTKNPPAILKGDSASRNSQERFIQETALIQSRIEWAEGFLTRSKMVLADLKCQNQDVSALTNRLNSCLRIIALSRDFYKVGDAREATLSFMDFRKAACLLCDGFKNSLEKEVLPDHSRRAILSILQSLECSRRDFPFYNR